MSRCGRDWSIGGNQQGLPLRRAPVNSGHVIPSMNPLLVPRLRDAQQTVNEVLGGPTVAAPLGMHVARSSAALSTRARSRITASPHEELPVWSPEVK